MNAKREMVRAMLQLLKKKRRGSLDPRVGFALAATIITAFVVFMIVAAIEPEAAANLQNSTLQSSFQTFEDYVGKSFNMWGLAIFISILGLILGGIFAWMGGGE